MTTKELKSQLRLHKRALAQSRANYAAACADYRALEVRVSKQAGLIFRMRQKARGLAECN